MSDLRPNRLFSIQLPWISRPSRSRRVILLLAGIVLLSLADLAITLAHLRTVGMMEANPVAVFVIRATDSPWALSIYKILTVGICVALLFRLRRHVEGEFGAWCALCILAFMSFQWHSYAEHFDDPATMRLAQGGEFGSQWLVLD